MTSPDRTPAPWLLAAVVALAYAAGSQVSFALLQASAVGAVLFPPAGVTVAALVLTPVRRWPVVLGTVVVVETAMDLAHGLPGPSVAGFVLANVAEPLVGATLLRRVVPTVVDLGRRRDLGAFLACCVLAGPAVGGLVGATTNDILLSRDWPDAFFPFWAGDGLAVLVVAGTVLTWRSGPARPGLRTTAHRLLLVAVTAGVTVLAFWPTVVPLAYLPLPVLIAVAARYGVPLVPAAGLAMTLAANVVTAAGRGPWAPLAGRPDLGMTSLQLFLAVAVLTAWLLAVEIRERQQAWTVSRLESASRRRVEALQEVTARLATAVTSEAIARVVVRHGIGLVADSGVVGVLTADGTELRTWATGAGDGEPVLLPLDAPALVAAAARAGRRIAVTPPEELRTAFPAGLAGERSPAPRSVLAVPARIGEATVGALAFGTDSAAGVDPGVAAVAETLAQLTAQALLRARAYEREHAAAHQLQRAFLPVVPSHLPGVDIAGCYRPADAEHDIGGDWYDVFPLPGGRVGFVVGDIVGHDLPAAAAMGRLHTALRVLVGERAPGPRQLLALLDEVSPTIPGASFATLGYGEYDPASCRLRYACAGHPPPLLVTGRTARYLTEGRSAPLTVTDVPRTEAEVQVPPGSTLLWYSDGLVERRGTDLDAGLDRLAAVAATIGDADPAVWLDTVMADLTGGRPLQDDVVLLCLRLRDHPAPDPQDAAARRGVPLPGTLRLVPPRALGS